MISARILCLMLPNVFCFGHGVGGVKSKKNNFHSSNVKDIKQTNADSIESQKKMLDTSLVASPVNALPNFHNQHASPPSPSHCQHIHLHFNGTRCETRSSWQMPCLSIFLIIIVVVLVLNCFHYNYELGVNYVTMEECSSEDEITVNRKNCRTKCTLGLKSP